MPLEEGFDKQRLLRSRRRKLPETVTEREEDLSCSPGVYSTRGEKTAGAESKTQWAVMSERFPDFATYTWDYRCHTKG